MAEGFILEIEEQVGQPVAAERKPQAKTRDWPPGARIVSADSHMLEGDLWIDRFPPELKDQAPRMVFKDGGWDLSIETALWSSDYPHQESTFGYTRGAIEAVFRAVPVEQAQMILGKTALKLFRMEP